MTAKDLIVKGNGGVAGRPAVIALGFFNHGPIINTQRSEYDPIHSMTNIMSEKSISV